VAIARGGRGCSDNVQTTEGAKGMTERALEEWVGELVLVHELYPESAGPGGMPVPFSGQIVRIGIDGFIFQPTEQPQQLFYPWQAIRFIERPKPRK
jgi:hypothetical protein